MSIAGACRLRVYCARREVFAMGSLTNARAMLACLAPVLLLTQPVLAVPLLMNPGFESGTLAGWTVANQSGGNGTWFVAKPGASAPVSGLPTSSKGGLPDTPYYVVTDSVGPGSHALLQMFTVAPAQRVILSGSLFVNNWGEGPFGTGLDYRVFPAQVARIDILKSTAGPFDVGEGVLQNLFIGGDRTPVERDFMPFVFDLTAIVGAGGTFILRFAEVNNLDFLNFGIINLALDAAVPEPSMLALVALALGAAGVLGLWRRRDTG
jgi:PEP-CTERM motif